MKIISCIVCLLALCACVYDAPFVEEAALPVDKELVGIWEEIPKEGEAPDPDEKLVILPFNANEYVVIQSSEKDNLYFRAYPVRIGDDLFVQLDWLGAEEERYHLCRTTLKGGTLTVETVNDKVIGSGIKTSKALQETLIANRSNPELFTDPAHYHKLED